MMHPGESEMARTHEYSTTKAGSVAAVVQITTVDDELDADRYLAETLGAALDAHAPDPAPGAKFTVEYVGHGLDVREHPDVA